MIMKNQGSGFLSTFVNVEAKQEYLTFTSTTSNASNPSIMVINADFYFFIDMAFSFGRISNVFDKIRYIWWLM